MVLLGWLIAVASIAAAALVVVHRRPEPLDTAVILLGGAGIAVWNITAGYYLVGPLTHRAGALYLVGVSLSVTTWLVLARRTAYPGWRPSPAIGVVLAVEPVLLALSMLLPADVWGRLFWPAEPWRHEPFGLGYQIHSPYCIVLIAVGAAALLRRTEQATGIDRALALAAVLSVSLGVGALIAGVRGLPVTGFFALLFLLAAFDRIHSGGLAWLAAVAERDPVTAALGRAGLDLVLVRAVEHARRDRTPLSVMVIDIDDFKGVNDAHGHVIGDLALRHVADRSLDTSGLVGRFGGDEFVVVLPGVPVAEAADQARRLAIAIAEPFDAAGQATTITVSIGVAECLGDSTNELLVAADRAMYAAKRRGGGQVAVESRF